MAEEVLEGEVITDESAGGEPGGTRMIRVYDLSGDYLLEVPSESTITFGYFNPAAPREINRGGYANDGNAARQTALRIYETTTKSSQLACFLGVKGFRDMRIRKTILQQHVTLERREESDQNGWDLSASQRRQITAASEDDIAF